jgi:hypothetical protein
MRLKFILSLFVVAVLLIGCGGGGDSSTDSGSTQDGSNETTGTQEETTQSGGGEDASASAKAVFIRSGDAACTKNNTTTNLEVEKFFEAESKAGKSETEIQETSVEEIIAPGIGRQAEVLEELGAPAGEEDAVAAIVEAIEEGAEKAEEAPDTLFAEDGPGAFAKASTLARAYGFKVCGGE